MAVKLLDKNEKAIKVHWKVKIPVGNWIFTDLDFFVRLADMIEMSKLQHQTQINGKKEAYAPLYRWITLIR